VLRVHQRIFIHKVSYLSGQHILMCGNTRCRRTAMQSALLQSKTWSTHSDVWQHTLSPHGNAECTVAKQNDTQIEPSLTPAAMKNSAAQYVNSTVGTTCSVSALPHSVSTVL